MNTQCYKSGYYAGTHGDNLYYQEWLPKEPLALMILLHGAGEHSGFYTDIGEECLHRQIGLVAPDMRGFGKSDGTRGHINHFREYLDDLATLNSRLLKQFPAVPLFLLGHSFGGLIAIRYVQEYPLLVKGVILSSPALGIRIPLPYPLKKLAKLLSWVTPTLTVDPFKWNWLKTILLSNPSDDKRDPLFTTQYTPRWFNEFLHNGAHAISEAAKCASPTLCLCGQNDPLTHLGMVENFFQSIANNDKTYIVFPEGRHRPLYESCRDEAVNNIFQWIAARL
ncbi:alpha/beta hydrolase [Brevibacillus borstelensis]|uniref:alpha/beta hydrolase n=1 Tax=Brevibacillus borstelensis TaxID=45462 RepID=UPI0030BEEF61